ncbi:HmuY family protein [Mesonia sp. K7]|uniref:HmuY family protein n=1 Tax=Mesonia sp. K7 TaxID=2218606 RepID=UPI000DAA0EDE|nr:HmuY family protein [Mesonia sp. K7]PZD79484.1 hypothetical protein DNG35_00290 [Mesonia sp. K7]
MRKILVYFSLIFVALATSCSSDDTTITTEFVAAFEKLSLNLTNNDTAVPVKIVFSETAEGDGTISIAATENNLVYGEDYTTNPAIENGVLQIPITAGSSETSFTFHKLSENPTEGEAVKSIEFTISEVSNGITQGNTTLQVNFSESASLGGSLKPSVGGPNQPNQVYIDLSTEKETLVKRDKWDLAFYSGEEFRVKLNNSVFMMAAKLNTTNIDEVQSVDVESLQSQMQLLQQGSEIYVDDPSGVITGTAIDEISTHLEENKVYLIHMGNEIGTNTPEPGSVAVAGDARGWKKIRVYRENGNYILEYANLEATSHQEIGISKTTGYHFTFYSMTTQSVVNVEPEQTKWDLNFTVFTEVLDYPDGGKTAYGFSDYVATNVLAQAKVYPVSTEDFSYQNFAFADVNTTNFEIDQRTIGANWRDVFSGSVDTTLFYIIEDADGNIYKLRFIALVNENGIRGYPEFEYQLLNQ